MVREVGEEEEVLLPVTVVEILPEGRHGRGCPGEGREKRTSDDRRSPQFPCSVSLCKYINQREGGREDK